MCKIQLDLIRKCGGIGVGAIPNGRSILKERLKNKICSNGFDFIVKLLDMTPSNRLSASQAVLHPYLQNIIRQKPCAALRATGNGEIEEDIQCALDRVLRGAWPFGSTLPVQNRLPLAVGSGVDP